ncbi:MULTISPECIES: ribonuclease M5 [unclassified Granulicatella]|uniref:ribonuclease M5 n=1 Tax=unclassified Granulicatella TaxID=2630493 RepID=UPI001073A313|nr:MULTISPECIES: ribonuclease M5 [unclassified Granulicatella]MBF0779627.1 ribonuclease M5 [Granulicatella sp. 19428wC4_WM01]TFU96285.1 ribonuclease M5 [Granulicatella sp. WM01]
MTQIIVVEGRDDTRRLREIFPNIQTIETKGSALDEETLQLIEKAHKHAQVIVLTDPDYPGERIRQLITQRIPTIQHAFLTVEEALPPKSKGSLGVEHASETAIKRALSQVKTVQEYTKTDASITQSFLVRYSLVGGANSKCYRDALSVKLGIGHVNGKQLEKRLNMFGLTKEQVLNALAQVLEEMNG